MTPRILILYAGAITTIVLLSLALDLVMRGAGRSSFVEFAAAALSLLLMLRAYIVPAGGAE